MIFWLGSSLFPIHQPLVYFHSFIDQRVWAPSTNPPKPCIQLPMTTIFILKIIISCLWLWLRAFPVTDGRVLLYLKKTKSCVPHLLLLSASPHSFIRIQITIIRYTWRSNRPGAANHAITRRRRHWWLKIIVYLRKTKTPCNWNVLHSSPYIIIFQSQ